MRNLIILLFSFFFLAGCEEIKYAMHYGVEQGAEDLSIWPPPPDKPRYRFAGELTGVDNFHVVEGQGSEKAEKVFRFLVGLDPMEEARRRMPDGLKRPTTGLVDAAGRVIITDMGHQSIVVFHPVAGTLQIWDKAEPFRNFMAPAGIAVSKDGGFLVTDADAGLVFQLDNGGNPVGVFGEGVLTRPTGIVRDPATGRIYVSDTRAHDIKVFTDQGTLSEVIGQAGEGDGQFNMPSHLFFKGDTLVVADTMNARVQILDGLGRHKRTVGSRGVQMGKLVRPKGVALDSEGNLYVVESFHDHLLIFDKDGNFLMPLGGTGQEIGQFYLPNGVFIDGRDKIHVADQFNGRVVIFQFLGGS